MFAFAVSLLVWHDMLMAAPTAVAWTAHAPVTKFSVSPSRLSTQLNAKNRPKLRKKLADVSPKEAEEEDPHLPTPGTWDPAEGDALLNDFDDMVTNKDGEMSRIGSLLKDCLAEVCNPVLTPDASRREYWLQYRGDHVEGFTLRDFFEKWLTDTPVPDKVTTDINEPNNPGFYITYWDYLANTKSGKELNSENRRFKKWFVRFLDLHGKWINSDQSTGTIDTWMAFKDDGVHPFDIDNYVVPEGGFKSFNQFFLRAAKSRPLDPADASDPLSVVSPCDGGVFYLSLANSQESFYDLPGKSKDRFNIEAAFPGYGASFVGGPLLDTLLWFTDYHHFSAPVSGKILHIGDYKGSYNYDFYDYNPDDPYAPKPPDSSNQAAWYDDIDKHRRTVWIIETQEIGLVAMCAVGFWGVGSIINYVNEGDEIKKGDYMGHFGYGGSSIALAFEPNIDFQFIADGMALSQSNWPRQVLSKGQIGRANAKKGI